MGNGQGASLDQVMVHLSELVQALEQIESVICVATAALRHQNCEKDMDVAKVLQRSASDRLSVEIESINELVTRLEGTPRQRK